MIEKYLVWHPGLVIAASAYHGPAGHLLPASMRKLSPDPLDPTTQPLCKNYRVQTDTGIVSIKTGSTPKSICASYHSLFPQGIGAPLDCQRVDLKLYPQ
jgi:hypothetical protein